MKMIKVESSNVVAVGRRGRNLYVEYPTGTYKYKKVPRILYKKLLEAPSKGRFMNKVIKNNFEYSRV